MAEIDAFLHRAFSIKVPYLKFQLIDTFSEGSIDTINRPIETGIKRILFLFGDRAITSVPSTLSIENLRCYKLPTTEWNPVPLNSRQIIAHLIKKKYPLLHACIFIILALELDSDVTTSAKHAPRGIQGYPFGRKDLLTTRPIDLAVLSCSRSHYLGELAKTQFQNVGFSLTKINFFP